MLPSERPPCPDPLRYIWVEKRDGSGYWRLKRGSIKPATLNKVFQANADNTAVTNEAARRVLARLAPFLQHVLLRRTVVHLAGSFKRSLLLNGRLDYSDLADFDFQEEDFDFKKLVKGHVQTKVTKDMLHMAIGLGKGAVKRHSKLAEGYTVELILLFGDPGSDKSLRVDSTASELYHFEEEDNPYPRTFHCKLSIQLPAKKPWMALVKVSCTGRYAEEMPKYKAMKVVEVGFGAA